MSELVYTPINAMLDSRQRFCGARLGCVAVADVTTTGSDVVVSWETAFLDANGDAVDLSNGGNGLALVKLVITNANNGAVRFSVGRVPVLIPIPAGTIREWWGFHTSTELKLEQGDTTGGHVFIEAYYNGDPPPAE